MSAVTVGVILLVLGNLSASLSDVAVKLLHGGISPYQYIFVRQLLSVALITPIWLHQSKQQRTLTAPYLTATRSLLIIIGSGCLMVAITHLPLATANAIIYAAPLIMLPLSVWLLKEVPPIGKVIGTVIGFCGVLIVLRPSHFHWAALFALGTATTLALFNILARKIPQQQPVVTTLFWTSLLSIPVSGVLAYWHWQPINLEQIALVAASALLILLYNGCAVKAYKKAPAGQIALAEYSGLIFVGLFGVWWFDEIPDWLTAIGIALIIMPLLPIKSLFHRGIKSK
ncbi:DMT family transporter [Vibrio sp. LaRot3]|uniref:DMT family transporter n=1 Tax=Vibrio sp. LaRot3 TaxID=2998829 RepID=UPI0022CE3231|nr:DMT family transporter [Vibrio sp. LaRot3]MDA0149514.1 DMT family transporter [Vibrio sp. LaRot3]